MVFVNKSEAANSTQKFYSGQASQAVRTSSSSSLPAPSDLAPRHRDSTTDRWWKWGSSAMWPCLEDVIKAECWGKKHIQETLLRTTQVLLITIWRAKMSDRSRENYLIQRTERQCKISKPQRPISILLNI